MVPLDVPNKRPLGKVDAAGWIAHVLTAPPALVGVSPTTSVFLVNVNGEFAYEMSAASSWTVIEIVVETSSAELFAQTVNVAVEVTAVGVP